MLSSVFSADQVSETEKSSFGSFILFVPAGTQYTPLAVWPQFSKAQSGSIDDVDRRFPELSPGPGQFGSSLPRKTASHSARLRAILPKTN